MYLCLDGIRASREGLADLMMETHHSGLKYNTIIFKRVDFLQ